MEEIVDNGELEYVQEINEHLKCSICYEVLEEAMCCKEGHTYCLKCIKRSLETKSECPFDRKFLTLCMLTNVRPIQEVRKPNECA
jgi:hypothetical protein